MVDFAAESCLLGMAPWCTRGTESDSVSVAKDNQPSNLVLKVFIVLMAVHSWGQTVSVDYRCVNHTVLQASGAEGFYLMEIGNGPEK